MWSPRRPMPAEAAADRALDRIAKRGGAEHQPADRSARPGHPAAARTGNPAAARRAVPGQEGFQVRGRRARTVPAGPWSTRWSTLTFGRLFPGAPSPEAFAAAYPDFRRTVPAMARWAWSPSLGYLSSDPVRIGPGLKMELMVHLPGLGITRAACPQRGTIWLPRARDSCRRLRSPLRRIARTGRRRACSGWYSAGRLGENRRSGLRVRSGNRRTLVAQGVSGANGLPGKTPQKARRPGWNNRSERLSRRESLPIRTSSRPARPWRLGAGLGMVNPQFAGILEELRVTVGSGHLAVSSGKDLSQEEEDFERANVVRSYLESV